MSRIRNQLHHRRGFTRIELLVVTVGILVLAGMGMGLLHKTREEFNRAASQNKLKLMSLSTVKTADDYQGVVPRADYEFYPTNGLSGATPASQGSCFWHILPNIESGPLFELGKGGVTTNISVAVAKPYHLYISPGDPTNARDQPRGSYLANPLSLGDSRVLGADKFHRFPHDFTDGAARTIVFAEGYSIAGDTSRYWHDGSAVWMPSRAIAFQVKPPKEHADPTLPQSYSTKQIQVGMFDGSVKSVSFGVSASTFYAACTPNSGDALGDDW